MRDITATAAVPTPTFNSVDLFGAIRKSDDIFSAQRAAMDAISADIVALEKYLQSRAVFSTFSMRCRESFRDSDQEPHFLEWCEDHHGRFRLQCGIDGIDPESLPGAPKPYRERKPLAETQAAIRAALYPCLPKFIDGFAKFLTDKTPDSVTVDL